MKSYTDLEQSRKLAEILPPESADMYYYSYMSIGEPFYMSYPNVIEDRQKLAKNDIPCWSLSALLDELPPYLFEFKRGIDLNVYPNLNSKGWHCSYMPNCIENMEKDKFKLITSEDSLVDACYEIIIKLHELNLL